MQVSQADSNGSKRVGVEEHLIKFRSSPNFKNMKKFIKSKIDHTEITKRATPTAPPDPLPPPNIEKVVKPEVQPPLPLDPPPPDNPLDMNLEVKKEIEDPEYQCTTSPNEKEMLGIEAVDSETDKSKVPICRDYIRGSCKRPGTCKYAHKYDVSQLIGVYTFCRKYQTSVCTFPNCKYVHASVFEEHHFYRTGYLPPHALAHHKKVSVLQPPPPPPPEEPPHTEIPPNLNFTNPPPPLPNEIEKPLISCIPASSLEARNFTEELRHPLPPTNTSPLKIGSSPCDIDTNEQISKSCKNCDIMEFRLQYNKDRVDKMLQNKEEMNKKMLLLDKKTEKLYSIILALLKPTMSSRSSSSTNGLNANLNGDEDKSLLEQLNSILNVSNRISALGEDK